MDGQAWAAPISLQGGPVRDVYISEGPQSVILIAGRNRRSRILLDADHLAKALALVMQGSS